MVANAITGESLSTFPPGNTNDRSIRPTLIGSPLWNEQPVLRSRSGRGKMPVNIGDFVHMQPRQAKRLGQHLRQSREKLGISARELARRTELSDSSIVRIEQGQFLEPSPETLSRIADALDLNLADLYVMADYPMPTELPSLKLYLRSKYDHLSATDVQAITDYASSIARRHGVSLDGPAPGEDEQPERAPTRRSSPRTATKPTKKGGTT